MNSLYRTFASLALPACVLLAAHLLAPRIAELPASLAGLRVYGVYALLMLGMLVALAFRRGRVLFALLALTLACVAYHQLLQRGLVSHAARTVFAALCVFVPLYLGALGLLRERGIFNRYGLRRLGALAALAAFTAWAVRHGGSAITDAAYAPLLAAAPFAPPPLPQLGWAAIMLGVVAGLAAWQVRRSPMEPGLAGAILAFAAAAYGIALPDRYALFIAAAALILIIAVLQDTFRMAFRDELTGLPSRRALNESLAGLGGRYVIAMVDVDHFKKLNDVHGHATGDQVLKMVAAQLARVGGGGTAYRYGGEEFTVVFSSRGLDEALPHLEALRQNIADYAMAVRRSGRQPRGGAGANGKSRTASGRGSNSVSVTISIGAAERSARLPAPEDVMRAADKALYRAKRGGRNRVCR